MYGRNVELMNKIASWFNVGDSAPDYKLTIFRKDGEGGFENFPFKINDKVMSISLDRRYNMASSELKVVLDNENGMLSPDYSQNKEYPLIEELKTSGYKDVFLPFNRVELELGYVGQTRRMYTGEIQPVNMISDNRTIEISCKDSYRKLLKPLDPITKKSLIYENKAAVDIVKDLLNRAGVKDYIIDMESINDKDFIIPSVKFELGTNYSDCISTILDVIGYTVRSDRFGRLVIGKPILYKQTDHHIAELDDYINISSGNYKIDPSVLRNRVIIQSKTGWTAFEDPFLKKYCNGEIIACGIESPWAETEEQRWAVADSFFIDMRRKLRRTTIAIKGDPTLDIGDLIRIKDLISTANAKYMITGIQSNFSSNGYVDTIDVEFCTNIDGHICEKAEGAYEEVDFTESTKKAVSTIVATLRDQIVNYALSCQGIWYQWGGDYINNPTSYYGVDCSHFTYSVYKKFGLMSSYATARYQYANLKHITYEQLLPGDLVFYSEGSSDGIHHVGLYIGNGKVISSSGGGPSTNSISKARSQNAKVKVHALKYMKENYYYARPDGL